MKVLIVVTNISTYQDKNIPTGLWLSELTHFYDACKKNNIGTTIISTHGGSTPIDPESLKPLVLDKLTKGYYADPVFMQLLSNTAAIDSINIDDYGAIYLTGGHGTMYDFVNNSVLNTTIRSFFEKGKIVAAVCHGVCGLLDVKLSNGAYLIKGKTITGYSWLEEILANRQRQVPFNLEVLLKERGANYQKALIPLTSNVKQDGNLITGQNPFSSKAIAERVIAEIKNISK